MTTDFKRWNRWGGWLVFLISFLLYGSTTEGKFSFWDTGEYISSATKLEVTHAPGAAFFQLVGAAVATLAFGNAGHYALIMNWLSALVSAFTILFLFWTISSFARRIFLRDNSEENINGQTWAVLLSAVVGSLAFACTDTFWYSAVEGEVYAMATMFIAMMVWLATRWEEESQIPGNERWLILFFFITGLSVGVHMMCMLAIPAFCLLYYARKYSFTWKSFLAANLITLGVLAFVFKIIFPLLMTFFGQLEIFFVNGIGLPFHSGTIAGFIILAGIAFLLIRWAFRRKNHLLKAGVLSLMFMIIGFACWLVIPIRANANPPMNLNDPDNALGMRDYYNRVQYGDWPTFFGQNYTAYLDANGLEKNEDGSMKTTNKQPVYEKDEASGRYLQVGERSDYVFSKDHISFFPRMFNERPDVMENYMSMYGAPAFTFNYDNSDLADSPEAQKIFKELEEKYNTGQISVEDYQQVKGYDLIKVQRPSFAQNWNYFVDFQVGYYFIRYLMWNFVGKQNDLQGDKSNLKGNWISGIKAIDNSRLGDMEKFPAKFTDAATTKFYFIPLLLALAGLIFQFRKDFGGFYAILSLFVLTSIGIIFYTSVKPFEVRERDYAMVGSFYAVGFWLGLGVFALLWFLQRKMNGRLVLPVGLLLLAVPFMMGFQNYQAHNRSGRTAAYDFAYSALKSLPKNSILFVYGDNDTFPIWAIQETEEFRSDVKVVNNELLATAWNIDQTKRRTYQAPGLPLSLKHEEYREGANDQVVVFDSASLRSFIDNHIAKGYPAEAFAPLQRYFTQDSMTAKEAMDFLRMKSPAKEVVLKILFGEERYTRFNFLPVSKFVIPVNVRNAIASGTISARDAALAKPFLTIDYKGSSMYKNALVMLDLLANFDWKRPIFFSNGGVYSDEDILYLKNYLQFDGFNYRLVPILTPQRPDGELGRVDPLELYSTIKSFRWGGFENQKVHFDETAESNIFGYRSTVGRAVEALSQIGERSKALDLLDLVSREIPAAKYSDARSLSFLINGYMLAGAPQKGIALAENLQKEILLNVKNYSAQPADKRAAFGREIRRSAGEYAMVVAAVANGYQDRGNPQAGYDYVVKALEPIDKNFKSFIRDLQEMGVEKANQKAPDIQNITTFYSNLFPVMSAYDTTFQKEKEAEIMRELTRVTQ